MPKTARQKSKTGIYHIIIRGINQQQLFEEEEDNEKFIEILKYCKTVSEFELYAYCLMGNHVHLLIKVISEDLTKIMKRIGTRYVYWYNFKYKRVGHLFQDRFKSEPVETDEYFLTVLRYIHQNPIKSNISNKIEEYNWSSYKDYINKSSGFVDIYFASKMMSIDKFIKFSTSENDDVCMDGTPKKFRLTDDEVKILIKEIFNCSNIEEFQKLDNEKRNICIKDLRERDISIRQISRVTGVSKGIIERL